MGLRPVTGEVPPGRHLPARASLQSAPQARRRRACGALYPPGVGSYKLVEAGATRRYLPWRGRYLRRYLRKVPPYLFADFLYKPARPPPGRSH